MTAVELVERLQQTTKTSVRFVRWRLKPMRWAGKVLNTVLVKRNRIATPTWTEGGSYLEAFQASGNLLLPFRVDTPSIDLSPYKGKAAGKPFIDIAADHRRHVNSALIDVLNQPDVDSLLMSYFDGKPWLWNVALNFSEPSDQETDSQLWHFDYGDTKQLHFMIYFSEVTELSGPFTFLPIHLSRRIRRHPIVIERLTDEHLRANYGIDVSIERQRLTGLRGSVFVADPGKLLHQGARCSTNRLVMFATFTSLTPMSKGRDTLPPSERSELFRQYQASGGLLPEVVFS